MRASDAGVETRDGLRKLEARTVADGKDRSQGVNTQQEGSCFCSLLSMIRLQPYACAQGSSRVAKSRSFPAAACLTLSSAMGPPLARVQGFKALRYKVLQRCLLSEGSADGVRAGEAGRGPQSS
ncbi:hypothetical protein NDU88_009081 [Pleurodeles waltl]|uniref:Uncharacterized protein n=1 Tax=Pleurodeles waltl TaxID=8319 RepID=A0AAV7P265_PLEWA|nr:hypothetical protein NDU88_009081 [Pleurodeles waltl]